MAHVGSILIEVTLDRSLLILDALLVLQLRLKVLNESTKVVDKLFLLGLLSFEASDLTTVLLLVEARFLAIVKHDDESDEEQLLLEDTSINEKLLLEESTEALFEAQLNLLDVDLDLLEILLPGSALLFLVFFFALLELLQSDELLVGHIILILVHPLFAHQLSLETVLALLDDELSATKHGLETSLADGVASELSLEQLLLAALLFEGSSLLLGEVAFNLDFLRLGLKD